MSKNHNTTSSPANQAFLLDVYENLIGRFIGWMYTSAPTSSAATSKAATAMVRKLKALDAEGRQDLVSDFIVAKLTETVIETYAPTWLTSTAILVIFKNFMINRYKHATVVNRHIVLTSSLNDAEIEVLMNVSNPTDSTDENLFTRKLELLKEFERMLPAPYKEIMPFYIDRMSAHKIAGILSRPERTVSYQVKKIEEGFRAFAAQQLAFEGV